MRGFKGRWRSSDIADKPTAQMMMIIIIIVMRMARRRRITTMMMTMMIIIMMTKMSTMMKITITRTMMITTPMRRRKGLTDRYGRYPNRPDLDSVTNLTCFTFFITSDWYFNNTMFTSAFQLSLLNPFLEIPCFLHISHYRLFVM